jgi:hypothetical protein
VSDYTTVTSQEILERNNGASLAALRHIVDNDVTRNDPAMIKGGPPRIA